MKDTILAACIEMFSQLIFSCRIASGSFEWEDGGRIGSPVGPNPRICQVVFSMLRSNSIFHWLHTSMPTLDVRPLSISCLWRNNDTRARPRPSSRAPRVRTPNVVDLPLSTFPTTAQRTSGVRATLGGGNRSSSAARGTLSVNLYNVEVCHNAESMTSTNRI